MSKENDCNNHGKIKGKREQIILHFQRLWNLNIQGKLLLAFMIMSFLPLSILAFLTYNKTSSAINSKVNDYATEVVRQISQNISRELLVFKNNSDEISFSSNVQNGLNEYYSEKTDLDRRINIKREISGLVTAKFINFNSMINVEIITTTNEWIYHGVKQSGSRYIDNMKFVNSLTSTNKPDAWFLEKPTIEVPNGSMYDLVFVRAINYLLAKKTLGYMIMSINEAYISEIYKSANLDKSINIFVLDSDGRVLSSRNSNVEVGSLYSNIDLVNRLKDPQIKTNEIFPVNSSISNSYIAYSIIPETGWYVISTIPASYLYKESRSIGCFMILISTLCIILALILSYFISRGISGPLKKMVNLMNEVNNRNFDVRLQYKGHDEIAVLASNFNTMIERLDDLIKKEYKATILRNQAELKALQAQINPHFLYNTLQVMGSMAKSQRPEIIREMCNSLAKMFRYSLNMKDAFATVFDELNHVQNYMFIQNARFPDMYKIRLDCTPELYDYKIPRLILQPLVENAIKHGLANQHGVKLLRIKIIIRNDKIQISVVDNGSGFDPSQLEVINTQMSSEQNLALSADGSIGLINVYDRIRMVFGEQGCFNIQSKPGKGSMIRMEFPVKH